jgi:membrane protease YdiL (CAAX protease family)
MDILNVTLFLGVIRMKKRLKKKIISQFPWINIALVFILSIPFWLMGTKQYLPIINLPISAFMFLATMAVALFLTYQQSGTEGLILLFNSSFNYRIKKGWYIPIFLLLPIIMLSSYIFMKWTGSSIPELQFPIWIVPIFFVLFFFTALCEEIFWQKHLFDPLQNRWNTLGAGIIVGIIWGVWHIIPHIQNQHTLSWIFWHSINTVLFRLLIVWLYNNNDKNLFAAISFHAMINVSIFLFPIYGSHYDPFITFFFSAIATAIILLFFWNGKTKTA